MIRKRETGMVIYPAVQVWGQRTRMEGKDLVSLYVFWVTSAKAMDVSGLVGRKKLLLSPNLLLCH